METQFAPQVAAPAPQLAQAAPAAAPQFGACSKTKFAGPAADTFELSTKQQVADLQQKLGI